MSSIKIESFHSRYIEKIIESWNKTLIYDLINRKRFINEILLDENFDKELALIAKKDDKFVGFLLGIKRKYPYLTRGLESERGWISIMFVDEGYQRQGIGQLLLNNIHKKFKSLGVKEITLGAYSPNYFTPGIDIRYGSALNFFKKNNYTINDEAVSMQRDLWDYSLPQDIKEKINSLEKENVIFKPYSFRYYDQLVNFANKEFGGGWAKNIMEAVKRNEAEETLIICINAENKIIGFVMRKMDGSESRFGPIGTDSSLRSKGIGGCLLHLMMESMRQNKIYYLYFLWTSGAAQRFYEKHDFSIYRTYKLSKKEL